MFTKNTARRLLYRQLKAEGMQFEAGDMLKLLELLKAEPQPPTLPEAVEKLVRITYSQSTTKNGSSQANAIDTFPGFGYYNEWNKY